MANHQHNEQLLAPSRFQTPRPIKIQDRRADNGSSLKGNPHSPLSGCPCEAPQMGMGPFPALRCLLVIVESGNKIMHIRRWNQINIHNADSR